MRRVLTILALSSGLVLAMPPLSAQDPPEPTPEEEPTPSEDDPFSEFGAEEEEPGTLGPRRPNEQPLELMTREELDDAGFRFGTEDTKRDASGGLLLSLTAGTLIHGIGHLYLGDRRTGWLLLGIEGASLGLLFTSAVFVGATEAASPWSAVFGPAFQVGIAGFVFSFLADVLGTITMDASGLQPNQSQERGVGLRARYGLLNATGLPVRHVIDGRLGADAGAVYGSLETTQDVFLDLASYRGRLGVRPLRGFDRLSYVGIEGGAEYLQWQGEGEFGRIAADGRVIVSYQLGRSVPHLDEIAVGVMGGLGNHWIQIAPRDTTTFELASSRLWVPFDVFGSMNVSSNLNFEAGYGAPELVLVAPIHRLLGVAHFTFTYRSSSVGDVSLRTEIGDGFAVWLGGGLWFGR